MRERLVALLGTWSLPPDVPAKLAIVLAMLCGLAAVFGRRIGLLDPREVERRRFLTIAAGGAACMSLAYISLYLRGGPRIIDATTYFLQARALSHGDLSWTPLDPSASFRGRFLVYRLDGLDAPSLGGIFPPGYPLLLAFGFVVGAPMVIGPLLAAALVIATYRLARELAERAEPLHAESIARGAALLSMFCAALRYHTADTMSHGATALGVALALLFALRRQPVYAGLALGFVIATRPVSAVPIAVVVAWLGRRTPWRAAAAAMPGVFLLLLSQRAVTGAWLSSTQRMYYALSDGPAGCFRWGFGRGVGCLYEHGDFVAARLANGFGLVEALGTTLRRLHKHALDVANFEPLALLVLVPFWKKKKVGIAGALVALHILVYLPFYFDGDYPGGGARFFSDLLPVEHALVLIGVAAIPVAIHRAIPMMLGLSLTGFAVHAVHGHLQLRDRDGGRPMFEPDVITHWNVAQGLVFVDTDHGFNLGHDPAAARDRGIVVARFRDDDHDRLLFEALGRPLAYRYETTETGPKLTPWQPLGLPSPLRFEGESEWPPLVQAGGHATPAWTHACASRQRALILTPEGPTARATILQPVPRDGAFSVEVFLVGTGVAANGSLTIEGASIPFSLAPNDTCKRLPSRKIALHPPHARVEFEISGGAAGLDEISLGD